MQQQAIKYARILVLGLMSLITPSVFAQKPPKVNWEKQYEECAAELKKQQAVKIDTAKLCSAYSRDLFSDLEKENAALKKEIKEIRAEKISKVKLSEEELTALERLAEIKRELSHPSDTLKVKKIPIKRL